MARSDGFVWYCAFGKGIAVPSSPVTIGESFGERILHMKDMMLKLYVKTQNLFSSDEGQDLVEYALVIALIALAATAGMNTLASDISAAFTTVGNTVNADV